MSRVVDDQDMSSSSDYMGSSAKRVKGDKEEGVGPDDRRKRKEEKRKKREANIEDKFNTILKAVGGVQTQMSTLSTQVTSIQSDVGTIKSDLGAFKQQTNSKFEEIDQKLQQHSKSILELQNANSNPDFGVSAGGSGSGPGGGGGGGGVGGGNSADWVPKSKRKIIFVRGFPYDSLGTDVVADVREATKDFEDSISDITAPKLTSFAKIFFKDSGGMWNFLKRMKGLKLKSTKWPDAKLFHGIDQTAAERLIGKKVAKALSIARDFTTTSGIFTEEEAKKGVDGDSDRGIVYVVLPGRAPVRLWTYNKDTGLFVIGGSVEDLGWNIPWDTETSTINAVSLGP